jgi:hypothetical protein
MPVHALSSRCPAEGDGLRLRRLAGLATLALAAACAPSSEPRDAALAQLQAGLDAVAVQQIRFHDRRGRYGRSAQELGVVLHPQVQIEIPYLADDGYLARAQHLQTGQVCLLVVGDVPGQQPSRSAIRCE